MNCSGYPLLKKILIALDWFARNEDDISIILYPQTHRLRPFLWQSGCCELKLRNLSEKVVLQYSSKTRLCFSINNIVSKKLNLSSMPTSTVNCNLMCKKLKILISLMFSDGIAKWCQIK